MIQSNPRIKTDGHDFTTAISINSTTGLPHLIFKGKNESTTTLLLSTPVNFNNYLTLFEGSIFLTALILIAEIYLHRKVQLLHQHSQQIPLQTGVEVDRVCGRSW
jgi:hypothetical protein